MRLWPNIKWIAIYAFSGLISSGLLAQSDSIAKHYPYSIGTQTFGASYGFSNETPLVETAKAIREMGSDIVKFHLAAGFDGISSSPRFTNLDTLIDQEPSVRFLFDSLDFKHYFMWVRSFNHWYDGYSTVERLDDSVKIYNLTKYLLQQYSHSGKKFFIGHWEGDWYLLPGYNINGNPSLAVIENMRQWLQCRQNAIDKAKLDYGSSGVEVYHYAEVNRVLDAYTGGKRRMVNKVIPYVNIDYVSYSAYDTQHFSRLGFENILNYIEAQLLPKNLPPGKRVFIGEFGRPAQAFGYNDSLHEMNNREILRKALNWCSPYILYWEMYNNEVRNGQQRGFWLIDSSNQKTALYHTLSNFYQNAQNWVYNRHTLTGQAPSHCDYSQWADSILQKPLDRIEVQRISLPEPISDKHSGFNVFPNPSLDGKIKLEAKKPGFRMKVYTLDGEKIRDKWIQSNYHALQLPERGMFIFYLEQDQRLIRFKVLH